MASVSQHVYTTELFAGYFFLSLHDRKRPRVIKEYFKGKVMLGFTGSNSNMAFDVTDIII